jgi:hypothetical protein
VVAALIDAPLVLLVGCLAALLVAVPLELVSSASTVGAVFLLAVLPLGGGTYAALLGVLLHRDRTLGQQARSLRVLAADRDEAPELWRRALREALKWTTLWLWGFASFLLYALVFRRVRRYVRELGSKDPYYDRLAGTRLVQATVPANGSGR